MDSLDLLESQAKAYRLRSKNPFKSTSVRQFAITLAIYEVGIAILKEMRKP